MKKTITITVITFFFTISAAFSVGNLGTISFSNEKINWNGKQYDAIQLGTGAGNYGLKADTIVEITDTKILLQIKTKTDCIKINPDQVKVIYGVTFRSDEWLVILY